MTDTQYDYIKENLPDWANEVERFAKYLATAKSESFRQGYDGALYGMAVGAKTLGMLSEASEFVDEAIKRAKEEQER